MKILCVFGQHAYGDPARGEGYEHANFVPALRVLGHDVALFDSWDRNRYRDFADLNRQFLHTVETLRPDFIFCVLMGYELWAETLDLLREHHPTPVLNWGTDDSWKYTQFARFIAPHVDCYATTAPEALAEAADDGLDNFVLTQWAAADTSLAGPLPAARCRHRVSFVGSAYGNRRRWIAQLAQRGIDVECFGHGWPAGAVAAAEVARIYRDSVVSLNFADSGLHLRGVRPYRSRQIKARVFEVPGGGGCLLPERVAGLQRYFREGEEVDAFGSIEELTGLIHGYLENPQRRDRMAAAAHERTRREHTYTARFAPLLVEARRLAARRSPAGADPTIRYVYERSIDVLCARHVPSPGLEAVQALLAKPSSLVFGERRGGRAARRLLFELSWRLAGARTYSATGWPGRLFYRDS